MKKLGNALLVSVLTCGLVVTPVLAEPSLDDLKKEKAAAESEVSSLQTELTNLISEIGQLEEDLTSKGEEIITAEEDLNAAKIKEEEQYEAMKLRIQFMYEQGEVSALEAFVEAENFSDMVNQAEYVQNVHEYDRKQLEEYVETKQKVADLTDTLKKEMASLETMQTEFTSSKENLDATLASKEAEVANFDGEIQAAAQRAAEERERQEEERRRQEAASTPNRGQGGQTGATSGNSNNSSSSKPSYAGQGNTAVAQAIVSAAYSQIGVPYVWGGTSPGVGLDCSGLVQYAHRVAGISIPRNSEAQYAAGQKVSDPQPGDIAWKPGHVGVYIGGGKMIEAQKTGTNIMVSNVRASGYVRFW